MELIFFFYFFFSRRVSSLPHPRRSPGLFSLAVTLGVALAAIFFFSIFSIFFSFGTVGFILFSTLSIFSCTHFVPSHFVRFS
ncbi:hypothetical protein LguiB_013977 [Lonicera macranthoides]